jgi:hypothetical protein
MQTVVKLLNDMQLVGRYGSILKNGIFQLFDPSHVRQHEANKKIRPVQSSRCESRRRPRLVLTTSRSGPHRSRCCWSVGVPPSTTRRRADRQRGCATAAGTARQIRSRAGALPSRTRRSGCHSPDTGRSSCTAAPAPRCRALRTATGRSGSWTVSWTVLRCRDDAEESLPACGLSFRCESK